MENIYTLRKYQILRVANVWVFLIGGSGINTTTSCTNNFLNRTNDFLSRTNDFLCRTIKLYKRLICRTNDFLNRTNDFRNS
jgi:hypothetical protein